mgnify:CR=1 FL=1
MNHETLKQIIYDQHIIIKESKIVDRDYHFEENGNYVLTGLRRAGKTTLLYKRVKDLIKKGIDWKQIIYINFDDERLLGFTVNDFQDILLTAEEITDKKKYYYFDEIQNIDGWEKFAIRLANAGRKVDITGSNAKRLSREVNAKLGGRYLTKIVYPFSFEEYLKANKIDTDAFQSTKIQGKVASALEDYYRFGGLPESLHFSDKREYISSVFEKVLLGDIIVKNGIRNENEIRMLRKKIAETICSNVTYSGLSNTLKAVGFSLSRNSIIDYCSYAIQSFLLFDLRNYYSAFIEKESSPKFYFSDNGFLSLFLAKDDTALFENMVAIFLREKFKDKLYYLKSSKTKLDIDFLIPEENLAIQACYSIERQDTLGREVNQLVRLNEKGKNKYQLFIVTKEDKRDITIGENKIKAIPLVDFLLGRK